MLQGPAENGNKQFNPFYFFLSRASCLEELSSKDVCPWKIVLTAASDHIHILMGEFTIGQR
jgi:hypothetical protein